MTPPAVHAMSPEQFADYMNQWRTHWEQQRQQDLTNFEKLHRDREVSADHRDQRQTDRNEAIRQQRENDTMRREAATAAQAIPQCDGSNPDNMREWLREIDMSRAHTKLTLTVAYIASRGALRRSLENYLSRQPDRNAVTWDQAKSHLQKIFLSPKEQDKLRSELMAIKQGPYELTPQYCMRFTELADSAYPTTFDAAGQPVPRTQDAEMSILDAFIGGLADRSTAHMCLNFGKPTNVSAAIDFVSEYDANNAKLDITRQRQGRVEEPMDISAINHRHPKAPPPKQTDDITEMRRQVNGLTSQFTKLMASMKNQQSSPSRPTNYH